MGEENEPKQSSQQSQETRPFFIEGDTAAPPNYKQDYKRRFKRPRCFAHKWVVRPTSWVVRWLDQHNGVVTAVATVAIAYLTWSLTSDSRRQAESSDGQLQAIKRQLGVMESDQRPWISNEVHSKFDLGPNGIIIALIYPLTNKGRTPAQQVFPIGFFFADSDGDSAQETVAKMCKIDVQNNFGLTIFPDQHIDQVYNTVLTRDFVASSYKGGIIFKEKTFKLNNALLFFGGCIKYKFSSENSTNHYSFFLYDVAEKDTGKELNIANWINTGDVSDLHEGKLGLLPIFIGSQGFYAN